ncbi:uncharacterized protein LOC102900676 isoform X2 [Felis catus]|uniref:uncharacterized protein LOC102900676 isoform X2 n=1 Tax=Felis catus TaxID=9685 RepID=UPI001D19BA4A|nr:uncharacterized protein LOC102900676 isoform X2 [Felis catus]
MDSRPNIFKCRSLRVRATDFSASTGGQAHAKHRTYLLLNLGNGPAVIKTPGCPPNTQCSHYADKRGQVTQLANQIDEEIIKCGARKSLFKASPDQLTCFLFFFHFFCQCRPTIFEVSYLWMNAVLNQFTCKENIDLSVSERRQPSRSKFSPCKRFCGWVSLSFSSVPESPPWFHARCPGSSSSQGVELRPQAPIPTEGSTITPSRLPRNHASESRSSVPKIMAFLRTRGVSELVKYGLISNPLSHQLLL